MNLASLWLVIGFAAVNAPAAPAEPPKQVETLLARLESPFLVRREDATRDLIELGYPALAALRRARASSTNPETQQRLERVIAAIEQQDVPRTALHRLADRLGPAGDDRLVEGLYLVALSRPATAEEHAQAVRQLPRGRQQAIADLIVQLRNSKEGKRTFLDAQLQMLEVKRQVLTRAPVPLSALNDLASDLGPKLFAITREMTDDQELAALFLVTLRRYPTADERRQAFRHRQKVPHRQDFVGDIVWTLMNSAEFLHDQ